MRPLTRLTPTALRRALALATALACVACSDGSPTGPAGEPNPAGPGTNGTNGGGGTTTPPPTPEPPAPASPAVGISFLVGAGSGEVGTRLMFNPTVRVLDEQGLPVVGATVTFSVAEGSGSLTGAEQVTDARGIAMVGGWTLGTTPGLHTLTASTPGFAAVTMTARAFAGQPAGLLVVAGDGQTATVVTNVAVAPAVKVVDRFGNGLPIVEVEFATGGENGDAILRRFERSDASGVARVGAWMLGRRPGTYVMNVRARTLPTPLTTQLSATAVAGPPARLQGYAGDRQTAPAGTTLPIAPAVRVTDTWGNPLAVAGIRVTFKSFIGGGSITGAEQLTDANGVAQVGSWTLGPRVGDAPTGNVLMTSAPGLVGVSFFATGT